MRVGNTLRAATTLSAVAPPVTAEWARLDPPGAGPPDGPRHPPAGVVPIPGLCAPQRLRSSGRERYPGRPVVALVLRPQRQQTRRRWTAKHPRRILWTGAWTGMDGGVHSRACRPLGASHRPLHALTAARHSRVMPQTRQPVMEPRFAPRCAAARASSLVAHGPNVGRRVRRADSGQRPHGSGRNPGVNPKHFTVPVCRVAWSALHGAIRHPPDVPESAWPSSSRGGGGALGRERLGHLVQSPIGTRSLQAARRWRQWAGIGAVVLLRGAEFHALRDGAIASQPWSGTSGRPRISLPRCVPVR